MKIAVLATLFATCSLAQVAPDTAKREIVARFGEEMAEALNARDTPKLRKLIDIRGLAARTGTFIGYEGKEHDDFVRGFARTGDAHIDAMVRNMETTSGIAKFMRVPDKNAGHALVRLELGQSGFDYLEFVVDTKGKEPRAVDWFRLVSGELMSVTLGGMGQLYTTEDPNLLGRLFGTQMVGKATLKTLHEVGELQKQMKFAEALAKLKTLPEPIVSSRIMLTIQASLAVSARKDAEYARLLARLAEKYSGDATAAFMLVDHYFNKKDLSRILSSLDTVEKRVGIDGVTRQLRAAGYYTCGDFASALKFSEESIRLESDRMGAHDFRGLSLVALARFEEAVTVYRDIEERFGLEFTRDSFADPRYAKLVASPAFKAWLK